MLTDAAALLVALMAVHFSQRKPNARHTFGYLRLTTLAAFLNAAALLVIVVFILWEAIQRFFEPQPVMGTPMLIIAIAGLLANLFAFWLLHRGSEEKNINARRRAACAGRSARLGGRHRRRHRYSRHRLDAD